MVSLFEKFKQGLTKTRKGFIDEIVSLVKNKYIVDDEFLEQIEEILIRSDIGVETTMKVIDSLQDHITSRGFKEPTELIAFLKEQLTEHLCQEDRENGSSDFFDPKVKPFVIMIVGVNGVGKTTTIAKLAKEFHTRGKKVILAAADTFRAAASEQLEILARRANVDIIKTQPGGDPAAVAFDAVTAALARNVDVVIVDTAGRLHTKVNLMEELKKIYRVLDKAMPNSPHEVLLVLDATTGQNASPRQSNSKIPSTSPGW